MLVKFILHSRELEYPLGDNDIRNWGEILCSYKRAEYGGVVRSFTSKFEFTNQARSLLLSLYMTDGFNASASISVQTMDNYGIYSTRFTCPLDFSTIEWDAWTLSINAVDNSLAALIKANKSTKYELTVGTDITSDATLAFDRIPMIEHLVYQFTQGESLDNGDIRVTFEKDKLPFVGNTGDEVSVNRVVMWNEDQDTASGSYILKAENYVTVKLQYELAYSERASSLCHIYIKIKRNGSVLTAEDIDLTTRTVSHWSQPCDSPSELPDPSNLLENTFSQVSENLWVVKNGEWVNVGKTTAEEYFTLYASGEVTMDLQPYDEVYIDHAGTTSLDSYNVTFRKSLFTFEWKGIGEKEDIFLISPKKACEAILAQFATGPVSVSISDHDTRLADTWLMAAESIRGISRAKFYSSFNEFCDWMSAVFGYVYYIGFTEPTEDDTDAPAQTVYFVHRSELLDADADVRVIENCNSVKYTVDSSSIYSSVEAGYDHKDYDSINGRDEFNFSNTYSTGCNVSDKKLSLMSKYRADCYGVEFAVQKRGKDTTDTTSDKDVFFILAKKSGTIYIPDRTAEIEGTLTDKVFNGAFCPMACIRANAGLIGLQSGDMTLAFASSTGNSDVEIDGEKMTDDIEIDTPLATCGVVEFSTDDVNDIADTGELIEIDDNGTTYCGFLKECDIKYAREGAVNYKLIVKEIDL